MRVIKAVFIFVLVLLLRGKLLVEFLVDRFQRRESVHSMIVGVEGLAVRMLLVVAWLAWRLVVGISEPFLLLLDLVTLLELLELLWVLVLELVADLVESDDVQGLLAVGSGHQNVGELVLIVELRPHVVHDCMPPLAIEAGLQSLDEWHHLLPEESVS